MIVFSQPVNLENFEISGQQIPFSHVASNFGVPLTTLFSFTIFSDSQKSYASVPFFEFFFRHLPELHHVWYWKRKRRYAFQKCLLNLNFVFHVLGKGLGKSGLLRHRMVLRDNIQGISKPAIRRLARRGGVKRISGFIYEETRYVLKIFLENILRLVFCIPSFPTF